jgi:hypothetical protein
MVGLDLRVHTNTLTGYCIPTVTVGFVIKCIPTLDWGYCVLTLGGGDSTDY